MFGDSSGEAMNKLIIELVPALMRRLIHEPEQIAGEVAHAIAERLDALAKLPTEREFTDPAFGWRRGSQLAGQEVARLRCIRGLLPAMRQTDGLQYLLGLVRIDGRPGDYISPPPESERRYPPSEEERLDEEVRFSLATADSMPNEIAVLWVPRPAVAAVDDVITRRGRKVEIRRQAPDVLMDAKPWAVRDVLLVHPNPVADQE